MSVCKHIACTNRYKFCWFYCDLTLKFYRSLVYNGRIKCTSKIKITKIIPKLSSAKCKTLDRYHVYGDVLYDYRQWITRHTYINSLFAQASKQFWYGNIDCHLNTELCLTDPWGPTHLSDATNWYATSYIIHPLIKHITRTRSYNFKMNLVL